MTNLLQQYFPMIRTREEILTEIREKRQLKRIFEEWKEEQQEEFLDFCTGMKGVKMMYDFMVKEILDPYVSPDRINEFLSLILEQEVKIIDVLPNDGARIADEFTLLIMDMVVQLEDGSIVDLEIQKIGYMFPGERSACYSADLLLRQYRRVRNKLRDTKKKSYYKDIKPVYTIVLFETSPAEFHRYPDKYKHIFEQKSDTGVEIVTVQGLTGLKKTDGVNLETVKAIGFSFIQIFWILCQIYFLVLLIASKQACSCIDRGNRCSQNF